MTMRYLPLFFFGFFVCLNAHVACAGEAIDAFQAGKTRLVNKLDAAIKAYEKDADDLKAATIGESKLQLSLDPKLLLHEITKRLELQRVFLAAINKADAHQIPTLLSASYQSCDQGVCQNGVDASLLDDAIVAFGILALQPLLDSMQTFSASKREGALNLMLQVEPRQCPATILEPAMHDQEFRVRAAALKVYKNNCASDAFFKQLDDLLAVETNPEFLVYLLDEVPEDSLENTRFHTVLLRLIQEKRVPVDAGLAKLCAAAMIPVKLDADAIDIPFWLEAFVAHPSRQGCLVENLFLKVNQEKDLVKMRALLLAAAEHKFHFSAEQNLYSVLQDSALAYWDAIPDADAQVLNTFKKNVGKKILRSWLGASDTPLGEKLLLAGWLGQDPTKSLPPNLKLQIEVRSATNAVVATTVQDVRLNQAFGFAVSSLSPSFQNINYSGIVRFNKDKLDFTIDDFIVGLSPAGAGFVPVIPLSGSFKTDLLVQQEKYQWKIALKSSAEN